MTRPAARLLHSVEAPADAPASVRPYELLFCWTAPALVDAATRRYCSRWTASPHPDTDTAPVEGPVAYAPRAARTRRPVTAPVISLPPKLTVNRS